MLRLRWRRRGSRDDEDAGGERHRDERPDGDASPADPVGEFAAERAGHRAEQGADEGDLCGMEGGLRRGVATGEEVDLQNLPEREAESDERAEGADVEEGNDPRVAELQALAHRPEICALVAEIVHEQGRTEAAPEQRTR